MLHLLFPPTFPPPSPLPDLRSTTRPTITASSLRSLPLHRNLALLPNPRLLLSLPLFSRRPRLCSLPADSAAHAAVDDDDEFDDELGRLLSLLPAAMKEKVGAHPELRQLVEVVMDLGRSPLARFPSGDFVLSDKPINFGDLHHATSQVGDFSADNRAGISRTLHRISAIRNRKGVIVGLTCRVGRVVSGSANLLRDLVKDGDSLLLIGPPGVGKTTIIREIARMLADDYKKRVVIVDTSNEIGGDGDIPHAGIGSARRLQVPDPDMQHKVLIEAVENHMPQVIVIDEIGTKLEAMAASTIAQRGIQLVATAHGVTIENLIMNPSLEMLVGGIQSVTLGDEEASRRGIQKTVLERKGPSTFACAVEIVSKSELRIHQSLEATVDALLSGRSPNVEVRKKGSHGFPNKMVTRKSEVPNDIDSQQLDEIVAEDLLEMSDEMILDDMYNSDVTRKMVATSSETKVAIRLYIYGIPETSVVQAIKQLRMEDLIELTDIASDANAFLALHSKLKKNSRIQAAAKPRDIPIYITKTSSLVQITKALHALVAAKENGLQDFQAKDSTSSSEKADALEEVRLAIEQVVIPKGESVELLPRSSNIISAQIDFIKKYELKSEKVGEETNVRLRILPVHMSMEESSYASMGVNSGFEELSNFDDVDGSYNGVARLPFLPD